MNNFWHFGDSFSFNDFNLESDTEWCQQDNFGHIISKKLGLDYKFRSLTGISNYQIFNQIIQESNNFSEGDVIFINWSFFTRGNYVDIFNSSFDIIENKRWNCNLKENKFLIQPTNHWFDENHSQFNEDAFEFYDFITNHKFIMDYLLTYNFDFNIKLFNNIQTYFKTLKDRGVKIFNLFIRDNEKLFYGNLELQIDFQDDLGNVLKFEPSYFEWLIENEYKGEEEGHYSTEIQPILAGEILKRMETQMANGLI
jgi:hypothetical protein